jgi:hypothetical protein
LEVITSSKLLCVRAVRVQARRIPDTNDRKKSGAFKACQIWRRDPSTKVVAVHLVDAGNAIADGLHICVVAEEQ